MTQEEYARRMKEMELEHDDDYVWERMRSAAGCLTPERAAELLEEVRRSREEWDREY